MLEPHISQFVVRAETMEPRDRRAADERAGAAASLLWRAVSRLLAPAPAAPPGCECAPAGRPSPNC
jgi:hypothetical protein